MSVCFIESSQNVFVESPNELIIAIENGRIAKTKTIANELNCVELSPLFLAIVNTFLYFHGGQPKKEFGGFPVCCITYVVASATS